MQLFTTAIAALSMSSVFAAPVAEPPQATNAITTVFNTVADVKLTVTDELSTVTKLVGELKSTVVSDIVQKQTVATCQGCT